MIKTVIKRDGSKEPFQAEKLNRWAEYATKMGGSWSEIAQKTFKRLTDPCTSKDIHDIMVDVCLEKQTMEYSRIAARLEFAEIRKGMQHIFGVDDNNSFKEIFDKLIGHGLWDKSSLPEYNVLWEDWYQELRQTRMEYWQIKQWADKYAVRHNDVVVETPHIGLMGIALALYGDTQESFDYAKALVEGKVNLPTPALNGLRNGDWDTISCCVISGGDTVDSIGVADYLAYRMTAKKSGIGIEFTTRSKGDSVKNGRVKHLGKWNIYKMVDRSVKAMTQVTRGGNATVTVLAIDPEIENILFWKSQRVDIEQRIDKLDYEFGYNDAFFQAVVKNEPWYLFGLTDAPDLYDLFYYAKADTYNEAVNNHLNKGTKHKKISARDLLSKFLTVRQETGRFYDHNLTRTNEHTPFTDIIRQSNLCEEICLPTKPYESMQDLLSEQSIGETAFCSLSALNVAKISFEEYDRVAYLALKAVDIMIDKAPMLTKSMKNSIMDRRSVGIGITGMASALYKNGFDYDGSKGSLDFVQKIAEYHYYYLLKASQKMSEEDGIVVKGVKKDWLPIDTAINKSVTDLDWESIRGKGRKHSVLVAHMPTEASSLLSGSANSLYPLRKKVINKRSRKGLVQFICEEFDEAKHKTAWDVDNICLSKYYARVQDFTDQAISCDFYVVPSKYPGGKVSMAQLMKEWVAHSQLGNKTKYYLNTNDSNGGSIQDIKRTTTKSNFNTTTPNTVINEVEEEEDGCESCKL
jgi:ribonucleoside-diphosphate reductase alpha chain